MDEPSNLQEARRFESLWTKVSPFGFACPACGSLEVFISLSNGITEGKCIDCNHDWWEMSRR